MVVQNELVPAFLPVGATGENETIGSYGDLLTTEPVFGEQRVNWFWPY